MLHSNNIQGDDDHATRSDVQDILDAAQIEVGRRYAGIPDLCEMLQIPLREGIEECNKPVDCTHLLFLLMKDERRVLDAYNKHRLSKASHHHFGERFKGPPDIVEYKAVENIPEQLEYFPLRALVVQRGFEVKVAPIYQVPNVVETTANPKSGFTTANPKSGFTNGPKPNFTSDPNSGSRQGTSAVTNSPKKKTGRAVKNYDKLSDAPSPQLDFPTGNMTLAEVAAFLPQSIRCWDVIDRALFNGTLSVTFAAMMNHFRLMPNGSIKNNSIYRMMKAPMDKRAQEDPKYADWTVSKHQLIKKPDGFDPTSISVAGFRVPVKYVQRAGISVPDNRAITTSLFRDLANGVKVMPSGHDALDLTRCVEYCVAHPNEDWVYPRDFVRLVNHIPAASGFAQGPMPVQADHQDASVVARYTSAQKIRGAENIFSRQRDFHGRLLKDPKKVLDDNEMSDSDSDDDSDEELNLAERSRLSKKRKLSASSRRGPKKPLKLDDKPRSSGRTKHVTGRYDIDAALPPVSDDEKPVAQRKKLTIEEMKMFGRTVEKVAEPVSELDVSEPDEDANEKADDGNDSGDMSIQDSDDDEAMASDSD